MRAWLKSLDLDTFEIERVELGPHRRHFWVPPAGIALARGVDARAGAVELLRKDSAWTLTGAATVNGAPREHHVLRPGDVLSVSGRAVLFLTAPEAPRSDAEAHLDDAPGDADAVHVWADWLLEHGDPLGEHLLAATPDPRVLEGLASLVDAGALELEWRHGLVDRATFRCTEQASWTDHLPLLRFLSLRVAKWTRSLTVDLVPWAGAAPTQLERHAAIALRTLLTGPHLPRLEHLSFGELELAGSPPLTALLARLPPRFPRLASGATTLLAGGHRGALQVVEVPSEVDFFSPLTTDARLPLGAGLWVGSSEPGSLRALGSGTRREGVLNTFVILAEAPHWRLVPIEPGVRLNGHPAVPTRLLLGDEVREPRGVVFRYAPT